MLRPKRKKGTLKVLTRHPSHFALINEIVTPIGKKVLWRAGSTTKPQTEGWVELNSVESIQNCTNKLRMKDLFEANGVQSPEYYLICNKEVLDAYGLLKDVNQLTYPILGKLKNHSRGRGMKKFDTPEELQDFLNTNTRLDSYYLEKYYNYSKEYRIHISRLGKCFYTNRKLRREGEENRWFFNNTNCVWILETNPLFDKPDTWGVIEADCFNALNALGMDIGAADVRVSKDGKHQIIELNSAPSFGEGTLLAYKNQITKLITE